MGILPSKSHETPATIREWLTGYYDYALEVNASVGGIAHALDREEPEVRAAIDAPSPKVDKDQTARVEAAATNVISLAERRQKAKVVSPGVMNAAARDEQRITELRQQISGIHDELAA